MIYVMAGAVLVVYVAYTLRKILKQTDTIHRQLMEGEKKEIYQASIEHPAMLVIENGREDVFADYTAVYGYPNYLFRADRKQKWTTEDVSKNFCIWAGNQEVEFFTDDLEHRKNMGRHLLALFEELAKGKHITRRAFYKRICFFNMWFVDSDFEEVNINMDTEAQALIMAIIRKMQNCEKVVPLCAVVHLDERVSHAHFLYYRKAEYRKVPHIQEILSDVVGRV